MYDAFVRTYAEMEVFSTDEIEHWYRATEIVAWLPSKVGGQLVRCHELARFVGGLLGLEVQDGLFGFVDHSWLWTGPRRGTMLWQLPNILDVYVPGQMPPVQLIHVATGLPMSYQSGPARTDIRTEALEFLRAHFQEKGVC